MNIQWDGSHSSLAIIELPVTGEHIAMGEQKKCSLCPIGLAWKSVLDVRYVAEVYPDEIRIIDSEWLHKLHEIPINGAPTAFIEQFDINRDVQPSHFFFALPIWMLNDHYRAQAQNDYEARLELANEARREREDREAFERSTSKYGLTQAEEALEAAMRE